MTRIRHQGDGKVGTSGLLIPARHMAFGTPIFKDERKQLQIAFKVGQSAVVSAFRFLLEVLD